MGSSAFINIDRLVQDQIPETDMYCHSLDFDFFEEDRNEKQREDKVEKANKPEDNHDDSKESSGIFGKIKKMISA